MEDTMEEKTVEMAILISTKMENTYHDKNYNIMAQLVNIEDGDKVRNRSDSFGGDMVDIHFDHRFYISSCSKEVNGYSTIYCEPYHVDVRSAKRILKDLEKIDKGLDRIAKEEGPAIDFAHMLQRVSKVLKIKKWTWQVNKGSRGWSYDDNEHKISSVVDGMYHVRALEKDEEWLKIIEENGAKMAA
jgi:hypothetical protein